MDKENYELIVNKVVLGMNLSSDEKDKLLKNDRMKFFAYIPYYLNVDRAMEYSIRNLALLMGDIRADWFPGSGFSVENLINRFLPLMLYPGVSSEVVEPLFYGPMVGMLSSWIVTLDDDRRNNKPNIGKEGVNLQALKDSYMKMAEDMKYVFYDIYPLELWELRGKWN